MLLLGVYVGSLLFGAILIGATLAFGKDTHAGSDHDAVESDALESDGPDHDAPDHDAPDHDHDHALDHHDVPGTAVGSPATWWLPFRSLRFWTFFLAAFGATGVLLTLASVHDAIGFPVALGNGFALGWAIAWVFEQLKVKPVSGMTSTQALIGAEAEVLLSIRPGGRGKIVVQTVSERIELTARTGDAVAIEAGARVLVAAIDGGIADVTATRPRAIPQRQPAGQAD